MKFNRTETTNVCPKCGGSGVFTKDGRNYACSCQRRDDRAIRRKYSGLPQFVKRPLLPLSKIYVENFDLINRSQRNWILFCGKTGTGKSTQAFMIADALLDRNAPVYVKTFNYPELVRELSALRFDLDRYEQKIGDALDPELVILDDFLDLIPKPESFEEQIALDLIKRRYVQKKPLILTTELTPTIFRNVMPRHGEALFGRIVEMCDDRISVAGPDAKNYRLSNY